MNKLEMFKSHYGQYRMQKHYFTLCGSGSPINQSSAKLWFLAHLLQSEEQALDFAALHTLAILNVPLLILNSVNLMLHDITAHAQDLCLCIQEVLGAWQRPGNEVITDLDCFTERGSLGDFSARQDFSVHSSLLG